ncbi:hypothetical protein DFH09DRAFT_659108 [Mycena vulgaris]|nr:hypothetical protein DFH09DRAFT_659108 [Mycena vulgaris]
MDAISPAEELELFQLISDAQTTNYLAVAALTVLLLEHTSTFKQEVKFVWQSRLSLWSVLYVWVRYVTLLVLCVNVAFMFRQMESSNSCQVILMAEMITCTLVDMGTDLILVLRVWILYGKSPRLRYILILLLIAEITAMCEISCPNLEHFILILLVG